MGENNLLAPHRTGRFPEKTPDGTIITDAVNAMWGTDMTETVTLSEGVARVFVVLDHANSEVVGVHAARSANRFEALEPLRLGTGALRHHRRRSCQGVTGPPRPWIQ